tara:strand:- start:1818 stop:2057 length:240 start_codon:yes stop_codon:yes gene_type:complete
MSNKDNQLIWEAMASEALSSPTTINRVERQLNDPELSVDERELVLSMLKSLKADARKNQQESLWYKINMIIQQVSRPGS